MANEWTIVDELTLLDTEFIDSRDNLGAFGVRAGQYWSETQYGLYRVYASNGRYSYEDDRVPYYFSDVAPYDATVVFNTTTTREETWDGLWSRWVEYGLYSSI